MSRRVAARSVMAIVSLSVAAETGGHELCGQILA
jgi:hypothetical protein